MASTVTQIDYVGGSNPIYVGKANPGITLDKAGWFIRKFTYDGNGNVVSVQTAQAGQYSAIWNNRASYTYS